MRRIGPERIRNVLAQLCIQVNYQLAKKLPPATVAIDTERKSLFRRE
ncbi:hypothetical protein KAT51_04685 [bacterium]|nr:hypothetical protein [bacterium]